MTGIVLVNKPKGLSSNTTANIVKAVTKSKKAGHLGTLDVAGEGLLPVALDKATTLFDYYLSKDKIYKTTFEFGYTTDTLDLEGQVTDKNEVIVTQKEVLNTIPKLVGKYPQLPPAYSAKRINGQRAYDLVRAGQQVELKAKEIEVYSIKLLQEIKQNVFEFEIHCSSGTYIRSICRDMASLLSTYSVMQCILRTKCGDFDLKDAFTLEDIKAGKFKIIQLEDLFSYQNIVFNDQETDKLLNGVWLNLKKENGLYKAYGRNQFLGVIELQSNTAKFKLRFI